MLQPHQPLLEAAVPPQRVPARDQAGPWHSEAVCRRDEAGLFFAPSKEPTAARLSREEAAKRVCARCPVMVECREHALLQPEPYGVWGGLTAAERRVVLARRRRREAELQRIDGEEWVRYEGDKYDALVRQEPGVTTVVTGTASYGQLTKMATALIEKKG
ncbi:Transcriptional regulator WhiB [Streptomyces antimycoticus]